jgi:hypothetical protein
MGKWLNYGTRFQSVDATENRAKDRLGDVVKNVKQRKI